LLIDEITTGASDDLQKVTRMSYGMAMNYGMTEEVGLYNFDRENADIDKPMSETMNRKIDKVAKSMVDEQYQRVKDLLMDNKEKLDALVKALHDRETLVYKDLIEILGPRPVPIRPEYEKYVMATTNQISTEHDEVGAAVKAHREGLEEAEPEPQAEAIAAEIPRES